MFRKELIASLQDKPMTLYEIGKSEATPCR